MSKIHVESLKRCIFRVFIHNGAGTDSFKVDYTTILDIDAYFNFRIDIGHHHFSFLMRDFQCIVDGDDAYHFTRHEYVYNVYFAEMSEFIFDYGNPQPYIFLDNGTECVECSLTLCNSIEPDTNSNESGSNNFPNCKDIW